MQTMEIVQRAAQLLEHSREVTLASITEQGYPRICVLSRSRSEGIKRIWVATGLSSTKVQHFQQNPKASACCYRGGDSVTLVGQVSLVADPAVKAAIWIDWFIEHFPGGIDDPNYCVLEFETTESATLWIDHEFVTLRGDQL